MTDQNPSNFKKIFQTKPAKIVLLINAGLLLMLFLAYVMSGRYVSTKDAHLKARKVLVASDRLGKIEQVLIQDHQKVSLDQTLVSIVPLAAEGPLVATAQPVLIRAPTQGTVTQLHVHPGEIVSIGQPLFSIVDEREFWVEAHFKETDLAHVRPGQIAQVQIDAYPGLIWLGRVLSLAPVTGSEFSMLPPQRNPGNWVKVVQRIMVKLSFDQSLPSDLRLGLQQHLNQYPLFAGMSAVVQIDTQKRCWERAWDRLLNSVN